MHTWCIFTLHQGVGVVEETGPQVKYLKKGDRVGWGYEHDSCGHCEQCLRGNETYCPERAMYGMADLDQGSFAHGAVWREAFLFQIPDDLSDEAAAPLQCGGATVFNALHAYGTDPVETVGIMGVGGLGHLAIQFAAKMGTRVVVLSGSDKKKDEALKLGAHEFVATKGAKELKVSKPLNRLLVTTSVQPQWDLIMPIMAPGATIHPLSVAEGNFEVPYMPLILNGITVQGSVGKSSVSAVSGTSDRWLVSVASRYIQNRMLAFAARHGFAPIVEKFPMTDKGITEAMEKLEKGDMKYRGVLIPQQA
jgi:D-arabinose 1-dehydrogenase-like Zn-dependent alcohol dehydrogenase